MLLIVYFLNQDFKCTSYHLLLLMLNSLVSLDIGTTLTYHQGLFNLNLLFMFVGKLQNYSYSNTKLKILVLIASLIYSKSLNSQRL
jgi:hypothetical protein